MSEEGGGNAMERGRRRRKRMHVLSVFRSWMMVMMMK